MSTLITGLLLTIAIPASAAPHIVEEWQPQEGDRIVVDIGKSIVYLIHEDGEYRAIEGLTGQRRYVSYDGISYFAATPEREWELRTFEEKGASVTFGAGRFGRLSWPGHEDPRRGDESTAYGIHSHRSFAEMLEDKEAKSAWDRSGTGYRSMGCILVSEEDLTVIRQMWEVNGGVIKVSTVASVDPTVAFGPMYAEGSSPEAPSWLGILGF